MRSFVSAVPLFPLAFGSALVIAAALAPPVARWLRTRPVVAFALLASLGLIVTATLLPTSDALSGSSSDRSCDLTRLGLPSIDELRISNDTRLNLLLFLPLGVAVALVPPPRRRNLLVGAILLPFVIEALQLSVLVLGRGCESADIIDNGAGLVVGLVGGLLLRAIVGPQAFGRAPRGETEGRDRSSGDP